MTRYLLGRVGWVVVVLIAITIVTFGVTFLSPVDPAKLYAGVRATHAQYEVVRRQLGLNSPVWTQYGRYVGRLLRGNLGNSYSTGEAVRTLVISRLPVTAVLAAAGMVVSVVIGVPLESSRRCIGNDRSTAPSCGAHSSAW